MLITNSTNKLELIKQYNISKYNESNNKPTRESNLYWRACSDRKGVCLSDVNKIIVENEFNFNKENTVNYSVEKSETAPTRKYKKKSVIEDKNKTVSEFPYYSSHYNDNNLSYLNNTYSRYLVSPIPSSDYGYVFQNEYLTYSGKDSFGSFLPEKRKEIYTIERSYPRFPSYSGEQKINVCAHCGTKTTSLWRKMDKLDICNACALYYKLHNKKRPENLLKTTIRRRNRKKVKKENSLQEN